MNLDSVLKYEALMFDIETYKINF